jgi:crotonobetainyl-CoA:carnitine CoA-transferase CaiB-like acyl-CoA transferase
VLTLQDLVVDPHIDHRGMIAQVEHPTLGAVKQVATPITVDGRDRDRIDPSMMIKTTDVAELVVALCRLSRNAAVPNVVLTRPGEQMWRA